MFRTLLFASIFSFFSCAAKKNSTAVYTADTPSIHGFKVEAIDGSQIDFAQFKGKKILIVNTASECGFTSQYKDLETLYQTYKDKLVVIGFPANNFGGQEPGTNTEIQSFCTKKFDVHFPMAAKISVKGDNIAPIYKWLTSKSLNGIMDETVTWNFNKFLLDENGHLLDKFGSMVNPMSDKITRRL